MSLEAQQVVWLATVPYLEDATGRRLQPSTTKFVLYALANYADPTGANAWPSIATIAAYTQLDRVTVLRALDACLRAELVAVQRRPGRGRRSVTYRLVLPRLRALHTFEPEPAQTDDEPEQLSTTVAHGDRLPTATRRPRQHHPLPTATPPVAHGNLSGNPRQPKPNRTQDNPCDPTPDTGEHDTTPTTHPAVGRLEPRPPTPADLAYARSVVADIRSRLAKNAAPNGGAR